MKAGEAAAQAWLISLSSALFLTGCRAWWQAASACSSSLSLKQQMTSEAGSVTAWPVAAARHLSLSISPGKQGIASFLLERGLDRV